MAFNSMKVIHGGLGDRLRYIMNPAKTENGLLCAGINTTPATAYDDMMDTKRRYGKIDKRQGYHIIQSFAPGEIEPDAALRFGMEFIGKYLENRYEGIAAVHTDKAHIHVHMIFNSVSFIDGKKYHAARGEYLFLLNYDNAVQHVQLRQPLTDAFTGETVQGSAALAPFDVRLFKVR